jgi:hypothetical protein
MDKPRGGSPESNFSQMSDSQLWDLLSDFMAELENRVLDPKSGEISRRYWLERVKEVQNELQSRSK